MGVNVEVTGDDPTRGRARCSTPLSSPGLWGDAADATVAHGAAVARQAGVAVELLPVRSPHDGDAGARRHLAAVLRSDQVQKGRPSGADGTFALGPAQGVGRMIGA